MYNPQLSARHFTDSAQRVVLHIKERAWDRGMICGELVDSTAAMLAILSILRWERKVGRAALENVVIDCNTLARELDSLIDEEGERVRRPGGPQFQTLPSGQKAIVVDREGPLSKLLDQAEHEALALGHDYVGTEHLLLAAIRSASPGLAGLIARHGATHDAVKCAVLELLQP
jgi:ATP-dependent Clp protease ATP-binding subunit ClpA